MPNPQKLIKIDTENLIFMWQRHSSGFLSQYLTRGFFNPLTNPQQIFTRFLISNYIDQLNPKASFLREEKLLKKITDFYLRNLNIFGEYSLVWWQGILQLTNLLKSLRLNATIKKPKILDVGCGAGNYYQGFVQAGLANFINFTGIDIAEKNIKIARAKFLDTSFQVGNIYNLDFADSTFDIVLVTHVLEHLNPQLLQTAVNELIRVTRDLLIINFFFEKDVSEHNIQPVAKYHWNCLSRTKLKEMFGNTVSISIKDVYEPFLDHKISFTNSQGYHMEYSTWTIKK